MGTSLTASTLPAAAVEQPQPRSNRAARPPVFARHPRDIPPRVPLAPQPRVLARVPARARAKNPRVLARAPVAAARGRARGRANFRRRRANFRPPPREDRRLRAVLYLPRGVMRRHQRVSRFAVILKDMSAPRRRATPRSRSCTTGGAIAGAGARASVSETKRRTGRTCGTLKGKRGGRREEKRGETSSPRVSPGKARDAVCSPKPPPPDPPRRRAPRRLDLPPQRANELRGRRRALPRRRGHDVVDRVAARLNRANVGVEFKGVRWS